MSDDIALSYSELRDRVAELEAQVDQQQQYIQLLEELAYQDPLTGAFSRHVYEKDLSHEIAQASRAGERDGEENWLSVAYVDLISFKGINDYYGQHIGDEALQKTVAILQDHFRRTSDRVYRVGGDEFALILPETDARSMEQRYQGAAEQVRTELLSYNSDTGLYLGGVSVTAKEIWEHALTSTDIENGVGRALQQAKRASDSSELSCIIFDIGAALSESSSSQNQHTVE